MSLVKFRMSSHQNPPNPGSFESSYAEREKSSSWASFVTNVFRSPSPDSLRRHQALTGKRRPKHALTKFDTPAKKPHHQIWRVPEQTHHTNHTPEPNYRQMGFSSGGGPHNSERRIPLLVWWWSAPNGGGGKSARHLPPRSSSGCDRACGQ